MKRGRFAGGWLLAVWSGCVLAHAHLLGSTPSDRSVLRTPPATLELHFSEAAQLTSLWIEKTGGPKQKLASPATEPRAQIRVSLPALAPGSYVVGWRALGSDGHVVPGQIRFTLNQ
jgi:methionine-rich copper-binding protein CopC